MKKISILFILLGLITPIIFQKSSTVHSAEIQNRSNENIIFEKVQSGVVTILGVDFGSGFFIDDNGLILTNYHVVKDQEGTLRVRVSKGIVLKADIIETNPQDDLAIIRVNLKALKYKPYVFSILSNNEVYVGQRVITIGSPIDFMIFDKTLTQGIVSKIDPKIIYHDISINGGNSGSPLINLNGEVLGVNTFIRSDRGQPLGGAIDIKKAIKLLNSANQKIAQLPPPSAELLRESPSIPYSRSLKNRTFKTEKELKKTVYSPRNWQYKIKGKKYEVFIRTPMQWYNEELATNPLMLENAIKSINNNYQADFDPIGDFDSAHIAILVAPNPDMTAKSRTILTTTSLTTCVGAPIFPLFLYDIKFKRKFDSISFKKENQELKPFSEGKVHFDNTIFKAFYGLGSIRINLIDKDAYYYLGRYDYKYFDTPNELYVEIKSKNTQEVEKIVIPEEIKAKIKADMKPYADYINTK